MNEHMNFQTIGSSFIVLAKTFTNDAWVDVVDILSRDRSPSNQCIKNPTYAHYHQNNNQTVGCGMYLQTYIYFYSFFILINLTFLNLFIAIILDGFFETRD